MKNQCSENSSFVAPNLVGPPNEVDVDINGLTCKALLDTGATVSSISKSWYDKLDNVEMHSLQQILLVECADGQHLPYLGYVEMEVGIPGFLENQIALCLVVPDTGYNQQVPVLLGTNVLQPLGKQLQGKLDKHSQLGAVWSSTFAYIHQQHVSISRNKGCLGIIKCNSFDTILVSRNERVIVPGIIDKGIGLAKCSAMVHSHAKSKLPDGVEIVSQLINYYGQSSKIYVELCNISNIPLRIQPSAIIGEVQQAQIVPREEIDEVRLSNESFLEQLSLYKEHLSDKEQQQVKKLLLEYRDIFSEGDMDLEHTDLVKHKILLTDNIPFKQRHSRIPPGMYQEVKDHIQELLSKNVIRPPCSPYSSAVVLVRTSNGKLRFCIDFRQLNNITVKDSFALPRIEEMIDNLAGSKYFSSLDLSSGYYQVELEEDDKCKTASPAGPMGFFEFQRMPFG